MIALLNALNPWRIVQHYWKRYQQQKLDAASYWALYHDVQSLHRWCGEFGVIDDATTWLLRRMHRYRAPTFIPYDKNNYDPRDSLDISGFREYLRKRYPTK